MPNVKALSWEGYSPVDNIIFVAHASYEMERSLHVAKTLVAANQPYSAIFIATERTLRRDENYAKSLRELILLADKNSTIPSMPVICERVDLINLLIKLKAKLESLIEVSHQNFVVDISVFPKDRLWVTLDLIANMFPNSSISLGYTEPVSYNTEESPTGWLSKGVAEVVPILGFNGRQDPNKSSLLIVNTGHENERMTIAINNREPRKLILISQGSSQHNENSSTAATRILNKLLEDFGSIVDRDYFFDIDSRDYEGVHKAVSIIFDEFSDEYNISVASFGTKVQSIGALMACRNNRRIEAIYAQPQIYHQEAYSAGVGASWRIDLPFGKGNTSIN